MRNWPIATCAWRHCEGRTVSTLSRAAEAWNKSDYFRRLKTCGADEVCIVSEQEKQMRRYREGLPASE